MTNLYRPQFLPETRPSVPALMLRDPLQKKRKDAEEHMRADTILVPVEDRPDLGRRFHRPPRFFHTKELFVGQGQVLGRKITIVAMDDPHAVAFFLLLDGRLLQPEFAVLQPANIRAEAAARDKTTGALGMGFEIVKRLYHCLCIYVFLFFAQSEKYN